MPRLKRHSKQSGLTLVEVMVALGVIVILVSGIFMVVQTSLKTVLLIDNRASREDEVTNLTDILRASLRNLPMGARMVAGPVKTGSAPQFIFIVRNAPGFLTWKSTPESRNMIVLLSLRQDAPNEQWRVCLKRFEPSATFPEDEFDAQRILQAAKGIPWLELVSEFQKINVRFFDSASQKWQDIWKDWRQRPTLIELTFLYEHTKDARSASAVFWIPPVKGVSA